MCDHLHMLISIPPKYFVAQIIGFPKVRARVPSLGFREEPSLRKEPLWAPGGPLRVSNSNGRIC
jgi:REP element-mobilizing transposase RayT